jgi:hypothetical protein
VILLIEFVLFTVGGALFLSELALPWITGRPLFPNLRKRRRALTAELKSIEQEAADEALQAEVKKKADALNRPTVSNFQSGVSE